MVFSSTVFLFLFLPIVLGVYALTPRRAKNLVLFAASLYFYAWGEKFYVLVMFASICSNYVFGRLVGHYGKSRAGRIALTSAVCINLFILGALKYTNFLAAHLYEFLSGLGLEVVADPGIHLPLGISFFTLQAISYIVDVYRGHARVQQSVIDLGLYISLFPQLIAGPIVRYQHIDEQLANRTHTLARFASGVRRFVLGLGKKVLIANPLSEMADQIFALTPLELTPMVAWWGLFLFLLQVYFDFSGYSDMAIGLGRMFGFEFFENFDFPYIARNVREAWRRWHISLTMWFRDYVYVPLGGNRVSTWRLYANLMAIFLLCGLWHGPNWTFIAFGLYHGFFLILERQRFMRVIDNAWRPLQHVYLLFVWMLGIVYFRAEDFGHATNFHKALFGLGPSQDSWHTVSMYVSNEVLAILPIAILCAMPLHRGIGAWFERQASRGPAVARTIELAGSAFSIVGLAVVLFLCEAFLSANTHHAFIYFQF